MSQRKITQFMFGSLIVYHYNRETATRMISEGNQDIEPIYRLTSRKMRLYHLFHENYPDVHQPLAVTAKTRTEPVHMLVTAILRARSVQGPELLFLGHCNDNSVSFVFTEPEFHAHVEKLRHEDCPPDEDPLCSAPRQVPHNGYCVINGYRLDYLAGQISDIRKATKEDEDYFDFDDGDCGIDSSDESE